ncbi:HpcH/HpaI aldolase/citrate lyase family protein [Streptomyces ochraceiscleroticus]|uniref:HpcH/HpaI aldolase/citrate lyase family protein n=1 Tax=Streptomyces ochraceiscleroticus TaxID=47761 RepID=A0ABW1ML35_9ACTN|nr:CoA ester lyase [Streptomyces ochraceiscleroticus]
MRRLRRSELSTPGSSEKMMAKAAAGEADYVFLDLEDAVAPKEKVPARAKIVHALTHLDWKPGTRAVRINSLESPYAHRDIIEIVEGARGALDVIIVPKVKQARDVWWVDVLLSQLEQSLGMAKRIGLEVLIEEVEGLVHVEDIATASPRLEALIFGPGDFAGSQGVPAQAIGESPHYPGDIWHYARNKIIVAARTAGIDAIDGPYAAISNPEGYRREALWAASLGYQGKWAIHPSQVVPANEVFSPSPEEVERARKLAKAYAEAEAQGLGALTLEGDMVDAASVRLLRNVLSKAELIGL